MKHWIAGAAFGAFAFVAAAPAEASLVDLGGFLPPDAGDLIYSSPDATVSAIAGIIDASTPPGPAPDFFVDFVLSGAFGAPALELLAPDLSGVATDAAGAPTAYEALIDLDGSDDFALVRLTPFVGAVPFDFDNGTIGAPALAEVYALRRDGTNAEIPLPLTAPLLLTALGGLALAARRRAA
ncbi:MAG: hypothetical protein AAF192_00805 [Pseudomonadota bacterium]